MRIGEGISLFVYISYDTTYCTHNDMDASTESKYYIAFKYMIVTCIFPMSLSVCVGTLFSV